MPKNTSILVATIGTRDLAFQVSSGEWLNIGNDRAPDPNSISEQALVQVDLGLENFNFRSLTEYLLNHWDEYHERLKPIILGKLIEDSRDRLQKIYLFGTNQLERVRQRDKDTLFSAEIIQKWIAAQYAISTSVVLQGAEGENPSDFEEMFRWWKNTWQQIATESQDGVSILLCLKGGVGQSSEASRVTALSRFAEDAQFYDFIQDEEKNRRGLPSEYTKPFAGRNYLWDRKRQEALALLERHDYEAVYRTLKAYYKNEDIEQTDARLMARVKLLLEAAISWNISDFKGFSAILGSQAETRSQQWWWTGYEAAYLSTVRFRQGNTVEALFHSFRAIEGSVSMWAEWRYPEHIDHNNGSPQIKASILDVFPSYIGDKRQENMMVTLKEKGKLGLYSFALYDLLRQSRPEWRKDPHIRSVWDVAAPRRNQLFHRLLGLQKFEVFEAWDTPNEEKWEVRILGCLNFLSEEDFSSLSEASLMSQVHREIKEAIASYQP